MNKSLSRTLASFGLGLVGCLDALAVSTDDCQAHYDNLIEIESTLYLDPKAGRAQLMAAQLAFEDRYDTDDDLSTECRLLQLRSLYLVDAYVNSEESLSRFRGALSALEVLGLAEAQHRTNFFRALVGHRRFEEARAYKLQHPTLEVEDIPDIADVALDNPTAYRIADAAGDALVPLSLDLNDIRLVAVVHPLCGFSNKALTAIAAAQPGIAPGHAVYLTPVAERLHLSNLIEWNAAHDSVEMLLTDTREDWPFIDNWMTPSFYILKDGEVHSTLSGWPDDSQLEQLKGLIDSAE